MERIVQLVLGLALLVFVVQCGAAETSETAENDVYPYEEPDENSEELALNDEDADVPENDVYPYEEPDENNEELALNDEDADVPDAPADEDNEDLASEDDDDRRHYRIKRRCGNSGSYAGWGYVRWVIYGHYKYRITPARTWAGARKICKKWGGDLASYGMRNYRRRSKIMRILKAKKYSYWIGLNDLKQKGCWKWVDGRGGCCASKATALWGKGEPNDYGRSNQRCVEIRGGRYGWRSNDVPCRHKHVGLCEIRNLRHYRRG